MVVGFTTTYAISAYHHWCCEFESRSGRCVQHYVIKFVSDLWQVCGFLQVLWFPPPIKTDCYDITEILLKVALNTINHRIQGFFWWLIVILQSRFSYWKVSDLFLVVGEIMGKLKNLTANHFLRLAMTSHKHGRWEWQRVCQHDKQKTICRHYKSTTRQTCGRQRCIKQWPSALVNIVFLCSITHHIALSEVQ